MQNILFVLKLPPPITGATLMNKRVAESVLLNQSFNIRKILFSYEKELSGLGEVTLKKLIIFIRTIARLLKELIFHSPDLVYFQPSLFGNAFIRDSIFVWIMKIFRVPVLFHFRVKGLNDYVQKNRIRQFYYRKVFKKTHVICLSELLTNDISNIYFDQPFIVYNGIPIIKDYQRTKKKKREGVVKIIFLSNLITSKGILDLIDALEILQNNKINFKCVIVGAEADLKIESINEMLRQKNISDMVECVGPKYGNEKYNELNSSDIFVFPTYYKNETWGGVLLEAMQFELPVISTHEGSLPIIVDDEETGFLIHKNRPDLIAEKIEYLINNPNIRIKMGEKGRAKFLKNFTFDIFEKNMKEVFDDILSKE